MMRRFGRLALGAALASVLVACGGGTPTPTPTPRASPTTTPTAPLQMSQVATPDAGSGDAPGATAGIGVGEPRGFAVVMLDDIRYEFNVGYEFSWGDGVGQCQTLNDWFIAFGPAADDSGLGLYLVLPPEETQTRDWEAEPPGPGEFFLPPQFNLVLLETQAPDWEERLETMSFDELAGYQPYVGLTDAWEISGLSASGSAEVVRSAAVPEDFFFGQGTFEVSCS